MVIRANGVCATSPDNMSFYVPKTLSVGKEEANSLAKESFLEQLLPGTGQFLGLGYAVI